MSPIGRERAISVVFFVTCAPPLASIGCTGAGFQGDDSGSEPDGSSGGIVIGDASSERGSGRRDGGGADGLADGPVADAVMADREAVGDAATDVGIPHEDAGGKDATPGCPTGYLACANGSCVQDDDQNCGACGVVCSGATPVCDGTQCVNGCPASKPTLCGMTCVNTSDDPLNCKACGAACTGNPANSQATCSGSTCGFTCDSGYAQCGSTCLVAVPDVVHGVFVAPNGPTSGCGTPDLPCGTISSAITSITQSDAGTKTIVYVAESAQPYVGWVNLPPGLTIEGGWAYGGGQWSHPCALDPSQTVIDAGNVGVAVFVSGSGGSATLRTLTLQAMWAAPAGNSSSGLVVTGSGLTVSLENVAIAVSAGGDGQNGASGANGAGPAACPAPGDSAPGAAGSVGAAGTRGTDSPFGYSPAIAGPGGNGTPGDSGGAGRPGGSCTSMTCLIKPALLDPCSDVPGSPVQASPGGMGCGGNPGQGGSGGTGGGASIAVYAYGANTQVVMSNVLLGTENGGRGGNGGLGGSGSPGFAGVTGSPRTCDQGHCASWKSLTCTVEAPTTAAGGTGGAAGGAGGNGGQGGGGAGGDSYCIYTTHGASFSGSYRCSHGAGGTGGSPNGPAGAAGDHN